MSDRKRLGRTALFFLAWFVLAVALIANYGVETRPCADWSFHLCYAATLDAAGCSSGGYSSYAPLAHLPAYVLGTPALVVLILIGAFAAIAFLLADSGGATALFVYVIGLPAIFLLFGKQPYLWISLALCGLVSFVLALAFFLFLLLKLWTAPPFQITTAIVGLLFAHNFGWVLLVAAVACSLLARTDGKKFFDDEGKDAAVYCLFGAIAFGLGFAVLYPSLQFVAWRVAPIVFLCASVVLGGLVESYGLLRK